MGEYTDYGYELNGMPLSMRQRQTMTPTSEPQGGTAVPPTLLHRLSHSRKKVNDKLRGTKK